QLFVLQQRSGQVGDGPPVPGLIQQELGPRPQPGEVGADLLLVAADIPGEVDSNPPVLAVAERPPVSLKHLQGYPAGREDHDLPLDEPARAAIVLDVGTEHVRQLAVDEPAVAVAIRNDRQVLDGARKAKTATACPASW